MTQVHEENGSYLDDKIIPGLTRSQVIEILPDLTVPEDQMKNLTEEGWCFLEQKETREDVMERVKLCMQKFKEMAKQRRGQTVLVISHGMFIHNLIVHLVNAAHDKQVINQYGYNPENNGLTIIDFDVVDKEHYRGTGTVTAV